jgi:hypothetical protein
MKFKFLLFIIFISKIILKEEGKSTTKNQKEKDKDKDSKTKEKVVLENLDEEKGYFTGSKIHDLNDLFFDYMIRDGKIYRWFILFYSKTCGHCMRAKREIKKVFEELKSNDSLRFAQIEAYDNTMTNVRFNITGVPYIIIVENNTMHELDLYPNYENLKKFIFTNFSEVKDELKPFPKKVRFHYVAWVIFKQTLDSVTASVNKFLTKKNIKIQFNPYAFILTVLITIIACCFGCVKFCIYCCCNDEDIARELKLLEEQYNQEMEKKRKERAESGVDGEGGEEDDEGEGEEVEGEEIEDGEEEEDDEGEEVEDDEKKKELSEEEKRKIEEAKKEEEMKKKEEEERKKKEEEEKKRKEEEEKNKNNDNKGKKKKKKKKD